MKNSILPLLFLLAFIASCTDMPGKPANGSTESQEVGLQMAVTGGLVRGITMDGVKQYHGIPYAAPPVGNLRWAPPEQVIPWTGVRDASEPSPICIQRPGGYGVAFYNPPRPKPAQSEDCLTLSVWTKAEQSEARTKTIE